MAYSAKEVKLMNPTYNGLIGHGKFEVYKCLVGGEVKAMKFLEHGGSKEDIEKVKSSLRNEVVGLTKAEPSPYVVNLAGVVAYQYCSGIIMEYMPRGNLSDFLRVYRPSFNLRLKVLHDIAAGINYLHHHISKCEAVSHNDLKPLNIVISEDFTAKICDFDGSDVISRTSGLANRKILRSICCYTENYASPELVKIIFDQGTKIMRTRAMDVYSFSMIMYFMLTGQHPFGNLESELVMRKYMRGERPSITDLDYDFDLSCVASALLYSTKNLMQKCWNQTPTERPRIQDVSLELGTFMDQINPQTLAEEIQSLRTEHPKPGEDPNSYCVTFDTFCEHLRRRFFQDDERDVAVEEEIRETELPGSSCKATATSSVVVMIDVDRLNVPDPKRGDNIMIKSPDKIIQCEIVRVDNISQGN